MGLKKFYIGALAGVASLALVACSDSATPVEGTKDKSDTQLVEVFNKAMERQESLESLSSKVSMEQEITATEDGEELKVTSSTNIDMSMTLDPVAFYVDGEMAYDMNDGSGALETPLKMYYTEADGYYVYDSETWLKLPSELYEDMLGQAGANIDATEQLKQLKPFLSDFTFEQNDSSYILTLKAKGEKFNDLMQDQLGSSLDLETLEIESVEDIDFENAKWIITIDKKTFDITKFDLDFVLNMEIEGLVTKISTVTTATYSDFNKAAAITIPKDVIENAIESEF